jgi:hypothetical protein
MKGRKGTLLFVLRSVLLLFSDGPKRRRGKGGPNTLGSITTTGTGFGFLLPRIGLITRPPIGV